MSRPKLELFYDGSKWSAVLSAPVSCAVCGKEIKNGAQTFIIVRRETNEWFPNCADCVRSASENKNVSIPLMMDRITKVKSAYPCVIRYSQEPGDQTHRKL